MCNTVITRGDAGETEEIPQACRPVPEDLGDLVHTEQGEGQHAEPGSKDQSPEPAVTPQGTIGAP